MSTASIRCREESLYRDFLTPCHSCVSKVPVPTYLPTCLSSIHPSPVHPPIIHLSSLWALLLWLNLVLYIPALRYFSVLSQNLKSPALGLFIMLCCHKWCGGVDYLANSPCPPPSCELVVHQCGWNTFPHSTDIVLDNVTCFSY